MTGDDMNANLARIGFWARGLAIAAAGCAATGCMAYDPFNQAVDPNSPAAQRVGALARADDSFPRWEDFPAEPQNVPTVADIRNRVLALEASEAQLNLQVAAIDWTLDEDDGAPWAERTRNRLDPRLAQAVDPAFLAAEIERARRLRERATPPPPINY